MWSVGMQGHSRECKKGEGGMGVKGIKVGIAFPNWMEIGWKFP